MDYELSDESKERLARFENVLSELLKDYNSIPDEMESLRSAGKDKTARYRELMGRKLTYSNLIDMFKRHGLI